MLGLDFTHHQTGNQRDFCVIPTARSSSARKRLKRTFGSMSRVLCVAVDLLRERLVCRPHRKIPLCIIFYSAVIIIICPIINFIVCPMLLCSALESNALHSSIGQTIKLLACPVSDLWYQMSDVQCPMSGPSVKNFKWHNSATRHPIDFMFGSRLGFLARTD